MVLEVRGINLALEESIAVSFTMLPSNLRPLTYVLPFRLGATSCIISDDILRLSSCAMPVTPGHPMNSG